MDTLSVPSSFTLVIAALIALAILIKPYLGLVVILATQPVLDLLPEIPLFSSLLPLIGAFTLIPFLINTKNISEKRIFNFSNTHILGLLLIGWIFISNPQAALFTGGRNWLLTYFQLWILIWMAGVLLDTPQKQQVLMWVFSLSTLVSAWVVIQQGGSFQEIDPLIRASGLTQGANTAARYFVVAFVFLSYLLTVTPNPILKLLAMVGMIITFFGVFYTVSRTGMILLAVAVVLLFILQSRFKYRILIAVISAVAFITIIFFSASILNFMQTIVPSISEGTDTIGLRYALWKAGYAMWKDHILKGVGIGMFPSQLIYYPDPTYYFFFSMRMVAHNMYISMLAETGIIGFGLFMSLLINTLVNLWSAGKVADTEFIPLRNVWLTVYLVMLLGGITKTDQTDKLLWLIIGVGVFFFDQAKLQKNNLSVKEIMNNSASRQIYPETRTQNYSK
jgi:O-antigen ligase